MRVTAAALALVASVAVVRADPAETWKNTSKRHPAPGTYVSKDGETVIVVDAQLIRWREHVRREKGTCWVFGVGYLADDRLASKADPKWIMTSFAMNTAIETTDAATDEKLRATHADASTVDAFYHCTSGLAGTAKVKAAKDQLLVFEDPTPISLKRGAKASSEPPSGFYCATAGTDSTLTTCARTSNGCDASVKHEQEQQAALGDLGEKSLDASKLGACAAATSAYCFADGKCFSTEASCSQMRARYIELRPSIALADCVRFE
jgi:hypothetical protein